MNRYCLWYHMATAPEQLEDDPAFRLLMKRALRFMDDVDDPEAAYEQHLEGDLEGAYDALGTDPEEAQIEAQQLAELAAEVQENNPELFAQLRDEYESEYGASL